MKDNYVNIDARFSKVLIDANNKFMAKFREYGDSWMGMSAEQMWSRLNQEWEELEKADSDKDIYSELLDLLNVTLMFAQNIKTRGKP